MVDESTAWNDLHARYVVKTINHQLAHSDNGACANGAESFFSRMRRAEIGHHHHIAGVYPSRSAQESAWREDYRRAPNGSQVSGVVALALKADPSVDTCGFAESNLTSFKLTLAANYLAKRLKRTDAGGYQHVAFVIGQLD